MRRRFFRIWLATWVVCAVSWVVCAILGIGDLGSNLACLLVATLGMQINLPEEARR